MSVRTCGNIILVPFYKLDSFHQKVSKIPGLLSLNSLKLLSAKTTMMIIWRVVKLDCKTHKVEFYDHSCGILFQLNYRAKGHISENTGKFLLRDLAALTNSIYCTSQYGALMNRDAHWPERISYNFLICPMHYNSAISGEYRLIWSLFAHFQNVI